MRYLNTNAELYHHGIKGQRWGVRRFQNEDGTLTSQGKHRYSRMFSDKDTYERIKAIRSNDARMRRMSTRQRMSLDSAERYWKARAEGKEPKEHRGIIKRNSDRYRSYSAKARVGQAAATGMLRSLGDIANGQAMGLSPVVALGSTAAGAVVGGASTLAISELWNKGFGHF